MSCGKFLSYHVFGQLYFDYGKANFPKMLHKIRHLIGIGLAKIFLASGCLPSITKNILYY